MLESSLNSNFVKVNFLNVGERFLVREQDQIRAIFRYFKILGIFNIGDLLQLAFLQYIYVIKTRKNRYGINGLTESLQIRG